MDYKQKFTDKEWDIIKRYLAMRSREAYNRKKQTERKKK